MQGLKWCGLSLTAHRTDSVVDGHPTLDIQRSTRGYRYHGHQTVSGGTVTTPGEKPGRTRHDNDADTPMRSLAGRAGG